MEDPAVSTRPLLVIVPAFNEEASVATVVKNIREQNYDVLVIDDGSRDATAKCAEEVGAKVLSLSFNVGVGGALQIGFRYAVDHRYTAVAQVDADGQHPVDEIYLLERNARSSNSHLVIGSRYMSSNATITSSGSRRFAMQILARVVSKLAKTRITDSTSGFRIICEPLLSEFARSFPTYYLGDTFEATLTAARRGFRISEVPATLKNRATGHPSTGSVRSALLVLKVIAISVLRI